MPEITHELKSAFHAFKVILFFLMIAEWTGFIIEGLPQP
jgi:hypothetical protein